MHAFRQSGGMAEAEVLSALAAMSEGPEKDQMTALVLGRNHVREVATHALSSHSSVPQDQTQVES